MNKKKMGGSGNPGGASVMSGETKQKPLANDAPPHKLASMHEQAGHGRWTESGPPKGKATESARIPTSGMAGNSENEG